MAEDIYAQVFAKVKDGMESEQWFLRADMTLKVLSRLVGTNILYLSKAVNRGYGCSFKTQLNKYRIDFLTEEAISTGEKIETVHERYGFWSRSTLYDVFRQQTGMSPVQYLDVKKTKSV